MCNGFRPMILIALLTVVMGGAVTSLWTYGLDTHHESRVSIWWPERGRELIPPGATGITLQRDLLDHRALYTIPEQELEAFLDAHFAVESRRERRPVSPEAVGKVIGPLGWIATKDGFVYSHVSRNGAVSTYYHDTVTGRTYQESAYW